MPRLLQVAQRVEDLDRAVAFYTDLLGADPVARFDPPGLAFFDCDGVRLLLDRAVPSAMVYLHVDDVRQRLEELRTRGVEVETEAHQIFSHTDDVLGPSGHDEWMGFVRDSEGNVIGLVSHSPSAAAPAGAAAG